MAQAAAPHTGVYGVLGRGGGGDAEIGRAAARLAQRGNGRLAPVLVIGAEPGFCSGILEAVEEGKGGEAPESIRIPGPAGLDKWNPFGAEAGCGGGIPEAAGRTMARYFGRPHEPIYRTDTLRQLIRAQRIAEGRAPTRDDLRRATADEDAVNDLVLKQEAETYSAFSFQFNITEEDYNADPDRFKRIKVTVSDIEESRDRKGPGVISPLVFSRKEAAESEEIRNAGGDEPAKTFEFDWKPNRGAMSVLIGDLDATVLRWELRKPGREVAYEVTTREQPPEWKLEAAKEIYAWYRERWEEMGNYFRNEFLTSAAAMFAGESRTEPIEQSDEEVERRKKAAKIRPQTRATSLRVKAGWPMLLDLSALKCEADRHLAAGTLMSEWLAAVAVRNAEDEREKEGVSGLVVCDDFPGADRRGLEWNDGHPFG